VPYLKKIVLIVDDSYLVAERLTAMISELNNVGKIYNAYSVAEALKLLQTTLPDVILLDINMPGTSGIELLRFVKSRYPQIIVTMVSNQANQYYIDLCSKLGADYFVDKSGCFDRLPAIISAFE